MNVPVVQAAGERRAMIIELLRSRVEPAIIQDFVSLLKESPAAIRSDLRALVKLGSIRQRVHKGTVGGFRDHRSRFCTWELAR